MSLKIKVDDPTAPSGAPFTIKGLGSFENGSATEVSEEEEATFRSANAVVEMTTDDKGNTTPSVQEGPTVREAVKSMANVSVVSNKKGDS